MLLLVQNRFAMANKPEQGKWNWVDVKAMAQAAGIDSPDPILFDGIEYGTLGQQLRPLLFPRLAFTHTHVQKGGLNTCPNTLTYLRLLPPPPSQQ